VDGSVLLIGLQFLNAWSFAGIAGVGLPLFQQMIPRLGLSTGLYMNTGRVGAIISGPIIVIGSVIAFGQRGILLTCAALTLIGILVIVVAGRADRTRESAREPVDTYRPMGQQMREPERESPHGLVGYDAELQRHNEALRQALGVQSHHNILDIGCGSGQTTRQAARTAQAGSALGVDVSQTAIERARQIALAEGLPNVTFEVANAQVHDLPPDHFDLAISRFGTMFFEDPVAAFINIGQALRPGGRLVMMVWQASERNEWDLAVRRSLGATDAPVPGASDLPDPFSLADPQTVKEILHSAGFVDVDFGDVDEPVYYGPGVASALAWVRGFMSTQAVLQTLDPAAAMAAVEHLREELAAHLRDDGVWFDSRAWIVTAQHR
jgi:SAM-dependent methyltransferase